LGNGEGTALSIVDILDIQQWLARDAIQDFLETLVSADKVHESREETSQVQFARDIEGVDRIVSGGAISRRDRLCSVKPFCQRARVDVGED
jgi:hypothetical protein